MCLMVNQLVPQNVQGYSRDVTQTKVVIRVQLFVYECVRVCVHVLLVYKCSTIHFILRVSSSHFCSLITLCSSAVQLQFFCICIK
jgi:hypothetical protein